MARQATKKIELASRQHVLDGRMFAVNGVSLTAGDFQERVSLRVEPKGVKSLSTALGLTLPQKPKSSATKNGRSALWLGPDEWLLIGKANGGLAAACNKAKALHSAVDISHRNTAIHISGPNAALALNSGCPQDLSPKAFPVGACSRTMLAKAEVVLWRTGENDFHIEVWRSFSDYAWKYLVDAAKSV